MKFLLISETMIRNGTLLTRGGLQRMKITINVQLMSESTWLTCGDIEKIERKRKQGPAIVPYPICHSDPGSLILKLALVEFPRCTFAELVIFRGSHFRSSQQAVSISAYATHPMARDNAHPSAAHYPLPIKHNQVRRQKSSKALRIPS